MDSAPSTLSSTTRTRSLPGLSGLLGNMIRSPRTWSGSLGNGAIILNMREFIRDTGATCNRDNPDGGVRKPRARWAAWESYQVWQHSLPFRWARLQSLRPAVAGRRDLCIAQVNQDGHHRTLSSASFNLLALAAKRVIPTPRRRSRPAPRSPLIGLDAVPATLLLIRHHVAPSLNPWSITAILAIAGRQWLRPVSPARPFRTRGLSQGVSGDSLFKRWRQS